MDRLSAALMAVVVCGASASAFAQVPPDKQNGRFTMSPLPDGGFLRLDSRSGAMSKCISGSSGWECRVMPDERAAFDAEIGRLQSENDSLRSRLAQADAGKPPGESEDALPKSDSLNPSMPRSADGERKIEIPLPSDRDVDRVMSFVEQVWRRLIEMTGRLQRDSGGKI